MSYKSVIKIVCSFTLPLPPLSRDYTLIYEQGDSVLLLKPCYNSTQVV